jgi:hypothetical protein
MKPEILMNQPLTLLVCLLLMLGLAVSCAPATTRATPAPFVPLPGKGGITGEISNRPKRWASEELFIYAAPYSGDEAGSGVYFLEPALHPNAPFEGDAFQLDAPPGTYVLVAGPSAEEGALLVDEKSQPLRIKIGASQVVKLGQVSLAAP